MATKEAPAKKDATPVAAKTITAPAKKASARKMTPASPTRLAEPKVVTPPTPRIPLEERRGQNGLNKLGIVTLVMGLDLLPG